MFGRNKELRLKERIAFIGEEIRLMQYIAKNNNGLKPENELKVVKKCATLAKLKTRLNYLQESKKNKDDIK